MNANLELYRVFCEVVKYQNISKAAENMYISQSAVTQSIQKLENMLGGKLFFRSKTGVELTEEGKNLYEYIKDSIETMSNAEKIFSNYVNLEKGKIRIGGGNTLLSTLVMPTLIDFIKEYPNIEISIINYGTEEAMHKLSNGELDIVVLNLSYTRKSYSNVDIIKLKGQAHYCFFASKSYLEKHPVKDLHDLDKHKLILPRASVVREYIEEYSKENDIKLHVDYEVSNSRMMKNLILHDIGIGYSNIENIRDIIESGEAIIIKQVEYENDVQCIATLKKNMCNKATLELANRIKNKYK